MLFCSFYVTVEIGPDLEIAEKKILVFQTKWAQPYVFRMGRQMSKNLTPQKGCVILEKISVQLCTVRTVFAFLLVICFDNLHRVVSLLV